jgi:hypothetical protein
MRSWRLPSGGLMLVVIDLLVRRPGPGYPDETIEFLQQLWVE